MRHKRQDEMRVGNVETAISVSANMDLKKLIPFTYKIVWFLKIKLWVIAV